MALIKSFLQWHKVGGETGKRSKFGQIQGLLRSSPLDHSPKQFRWCFGSCPIVNILNVRVRLGLPTSTALAAAGPRTTTTTFAIRGRCTSVSPGSPQSTCRRGGRRRGCSRRSTLPPLDRWRGIVLQPSRPLTTMGHRCDPSLSPSNTHSVHAPLYRRFLIHPVHCLFFTAAIVPLPAQFTTKVSLGVVLGREFDFWLKLYKIQLDTATTSTALLDGLQSCG